MSFLEPFAVVVLIFPVLVINIFVSPLRPLQQLLVHRLRE